MQPHPTPQQDETAKLYKSPQKTGGSKTPPASMSLLQSVMLTLLHIINFSYLHLQHCA
jgi:hypothetical protein